MKSISKFMEAILIALLSLSVYAMPPNPNTKTPVIVFSDATNADDIMSLIMISQAKNLDLKAIYLTGNAFAEIGGSSRNVYNLLDMTGNTETLVFLGSYYSTLEYECPNGLCKKPDNISAQFVTSTSVAGVPRNANSATMWGLQQILPISTRHYSISLYGGALYNPKDDDVAAVEGIQDIIAHTPGVVIYTIGTLTGPYRVLNGYKQAYHEAVGPLPETAIQNISRVVMMGGAFDINGNLFSVPYNTKAEWNVYADPLAANWFFGFLKDNHIPTKIVSLDTTAGMPMTTTYLNNLNAAANGVNGTPVSQFASMFEQKLADTWFEGPNPPSLLLWDRLAALTLISPNLFFDNKCYQTISVVDRLDHDASRPLIDIRVNTNSNRVVITNTLPLNFGQTIGKDQVTPGSADALFCVQKFNTSYDIYQEIINAIVPPVNP